MLAGMALLQALLFLVGIAALYFGAGWLVQGATRLARSFGVSALVAGLTVVSMGTSAPELIVSVLAALRGQSGIAIGNVVGSNISNVALVLGASALVFPLAVQPRIVAREIPLMLGATVLAIVLALGGYGRLDGALLVGALILYLALLFVTARRDPAVAAEVTAEGDAGDGAARARGRNLALVVLGLGVLTVGAQLLVNAATFFARAFGLSDLVIGLTVVAVGTSLPELATSLLAAFRRQNDIAIGNIVGSNVFNVLGILGVTALVRPIAVDPALFRFEFPALLGVSALLLLFAWTRQRVERWEGAALLAVYIAFTWILLTRGG